ncbi:MAG: 30S ribosomal protein S12 methylthiotransferase RimO [Thermovenabulum sp.]|uniref:30S ribosomal protein S12 methylthiotransferase RimO n=1 Tax=Thermovenabulum sp. TaxID=3100335 RepID=UPI003C7A7597
MAERIGLITLGCDKNLVDSELILGALKKEGYDFTDDVYEADIIIVNTCGFIKSAKEESLNALRKIARVKKSKKDVFIVAAGCLAQLLGEQIKEKIPEIDAVVGSGDFYKLPYIIKNKKTAVEIKNQSFLNYNEMDRVLSDTLSAHIKIAEGCDNCCSYCVIPKIKGRYKSRPLDSIIKEAKFLISKGVKEINLVAQDITSYGKDIYGKYYLCELLKRLSEIEGDFWIRLLYAYPTHINDELIEVIAKSDKILKYLDIPLQHVNDRILSLMKRKTNSKDIKNLIIKLRQMIPEIAIRTTFIVGFPSERQEEFEELIDFIWTYQIDRVGAFKYSREEGTLAYQMNMHVPERIKEKRYNELMKTQKLISKTINKRFIGRKLKVLVEGYMKERGIYFGRSYRDSKNVDGVVFIEGSNIKIGDFTNVLIKEAFEYDLYGMKV